MNMPVRFPSRGETIIREVRQDALLTGEQRLARAKVLWESAMMLRRANPRAAEIEASEETLRQRNHQRLLEFLRSHANRAH